VEVKLIKKLETKADENATCIEINNCGRMVCVGTNKGSLRVYLLPSGQFKEYRAHTSPICKICVACSDDYLITCSDDGAIVYWQIGNKLRDSTIVPAVTQVTHVALADQDEYEKQMLEGEKWERKLREFETEADFVSRMKELKFDIKKREMTGRFNAQLINVVKQIEREIENDKARVVEFVSIYEKTSREHFEQVESLIETYREKTKYEMAKFEEILSQIEVAENQIRENSTKLAELERKEKYETIDKFDAKKIRFVKKSITNSFDCEDDADLVENVIELSYDYEQRLTELIAENERTKNEIDVLKNELKNKRGALKLKLDLKYDEDENDLTENKPSDGCCPSYLVKIENLVLADLIKEMRQIRLKLLNAKKMLL
jgi:hypothetical protein